MGLDVTSLLKDGVSAAVNSLGSSIKNAVSAFKADPTRVDELSAEIQKATLLHEETMAKLGNDVQVAMEQEATKQQQVVNDTMQIEDKSDHFLTYSWRPIIGYVFAIMILNNYVAYPYLHNYGAVLLDIPYYVFVTLGSILGITAAGRTLEKIQALK